MNKFISKEAIKSGFIPGLIANLCCLGPLILIMMGLISASTALSLVAYKGWFLAFSITLLVGTLWFYIKRRRQIICSGCQTKSEERKRITTFIVSSVTVSLLTFALVFYVVLPWLAPIVFENFYTKPVINQPVINQPNTSASSVAEKKPEQRMLAVISIGGFDCPSCPVIAENALKDTQGVIDARTTSTGEASRVLYDASIVTIDDLRKVLGKDGVYTIDRVISDQPSQKERLE